MSLDLLKKGPSHYQCVGFRVSQAASRSPRFQQIDWVLRQGFSGPFVRVHGVFPLPMDRKGVQLWVNGSIDLEGVRGLIKRWIWSESHTEWARLPDLPDFSTMIGAVCDSDRRWGDRLCSWCFPTAHGYRKGGQMWVDGSKHLEGVQLLRCRIPSCFVTV